MDSTDYMKSTHLGSPMRLPGVNISPETINAVPNRRPRPSGKNVTGVYLGAESTSNALPTKQTTIPPLARPRGIPLKARTPTEQRRYLYKHESGTNTALYVIFYQPKSSDHKLVNYKKSLLPPLPQLLQSQFPVMSPKKMVELLRIRDDRRGFSGQALKGRKPDDDYSASRNSPTRISRASTDFWSLTKQNPRQYTTVNNAGVSHREFLVSSVPHNDNCNDGDEGDSLTSAVLQEVDRLAADKRDVVGLVECYRKVCKGNYDNLQHLVPQKSNKKPKVKYTGFSVKSYRNPNQAEIDADFPLLEFRPHTVLGSYSPKTFLPASYFLKTYQPHHLLYDDHSSSGGSRSLVSQSREGRGSRKGRLIARSLGSSRSIHGRIEEFESYNRKPICKDIAHPSTPTTVGYCAPVERRTQPEDNANHIHSASDETVEIPVAALFESRLVPHSTIQSSTKVEVELLPETNQENSLTVSQERKEEEKEDMALKVNNAVPIVIGLEDESGIKVPVKIDEPRNETGDTRVLQNRNSGDDSNQQKDQKVPVRSRKAELQELLQEHAQIIQEVQDMQTKVETPGSDKENKTFNPPE